MNYGKMKLFSMLMVPLFVMLSFAAAKTTLVQADSSDSSIQEIESVARLTGPSVPGYGLAFEATVAATGSLTITGVHVSTTGATFATIKWETDDPGNSVVRYGVATDPLPLSQEVTIAVAATNHDVGLTNLDPATKYFYEVETNDIDGDMAVDNNGGSFYDFTTSAATGSLTISGVVVSITGATSATVIWETDNPSSGKVRYGLVTDPHEYEVTSPITATAHSVGLTNLTPATQYLFEVESIDDDGNMAFDDNGGSHYSFTTTDEIVKPVEPALGQRKAFVGTVVGDPGTTVVLNLQTTGKKLTINIPEGYDSVRTPGGPRAGKFVDSARVVILAENVGGGWWAIWVLVKPIKPITPVSGVVTGVGPTSITITGPDGETHLIRLTGQAKKAAKDLEIGEVVTVLRGNGNRAKGLVTANEVRNRMLADIEEDGEDQAEEEEGDEEKKFKSKRADALIRGLERLGRQQLRVLGNALDRVPDHVKEKFFTAKFRMEEGIKVAKEASHRARGRFKLFESENSDEEDNSGPGNSKNRGPSDNRGKASRFEGVDSSGKSGNSGKSGRGGRNSSGEGEHNEPDEEEEDDY